MAAVLFNLQIGALTPLLVIGSVAVFCILRWERLYPLLIDCWPLVILPLFVCASAAWSDVPGTSIYYGILYALTVVAGVLLGGGVRPRSFVIGFFLATVLYILTSAVFGRFVAWGAGGAQAFAGLAGSKNSFGDFTGMGLIATTAVLTLFLGERRLVPAAFCAGLIPVMLVLLMMARATSALVATLVAVSCFVLFALSRRLELQARSAILVGALIVMTIALLTSNYWYQPFFDIFLDITGKNRGLTGRVDLWQFGQVIMDQNPVLGIGYNSFWIHGNLDAERLWRMMGITTRMGFHFHNTFMEIRVHNGWVGLSIFMMVWVYATVRLLLRALLHPTIPLILASALVFFFALKLEFELIGYSTMDIMTIVSFAVLAMGLRRIEPGRTRPTRPTRPPLTSA